MPAGTSTIAAILIQYTVSFCSGKSLPRWSSALYSYSDSPRIGSGPRISFSVNVPEPGARGLRNTT